MHHDHKNFARTTRWVAACGLAIAAMGVADLHAQDAGGRRQAKPVNQPETRPSRPAPEGQPAPNTPTRPAPTRPAGNGARGAGAGGQAQPQPVTRPDMLPGQTAEGGEMVTLNQFAEPIELKALVEYVAETLQINVVGSDALTGSVVINAPVTVPKDELLMLLASLLEQQAFTIVLDQSGFYRILESNKVQPNFTMGELATTRLIATPTLKPSSLQDAVAKQFGDPQSGQPMGRVAFLDDLGIIVITDTPRRVKAMEEFIARLLEQKRQQTFQRFELDHVSAATARQRAIELIGQVQPNYGQQGQPGVPVPMPTPGGGTPAASLNNLADRLTIDAQGNALIFRGTEEESVELRSVLSVIDVPSTLEVRSYFAGSAAGEISKIASGFGLGSVQQIDTAAGGVDPSTGMPMPNPAAMMPGGDPSQHGGSGGGRVGRAHDGRRYRPRADPLLRHAHAAHDARAADQAFRYAARRGGDRVLQAQERQGRGSGRIAQRHSE
jgi:hypothetical protein